MSSVPTSDYRQYFLPGWGISRHIIFSHIHYFLGPDSTSQIEDLQNLSRQYEQQAAERMTAGEGQSAGYAFINRPVQMQQRRRYVQNDYWR
ncbi:MAG: hypothetical protein L6R35_001394, partial [Caloplaca aegaea]